MAEADLFAAFFVPDQLALFDKKVLRVVPARDLNRVQARAIVGEVWKHSQSSAVVRSRPTTNLALAMLLKREDLCLPTVKELFAVATPRRDCSELKHAVQ
jgi:hypothetical protein